jgi:ubiquitin-protein ligase
VLTGGIAFRPPSFEKGKSFFEQEAFLNLRVRQYQPCPRGIADDEAFVAAIPEDVASLYATEAPNLQWIKGQKIIQLMSPEYYLRDAGDKRRTTDRCWARIRRELQGFVGERKPLFCQVWLSRTDIALWRVFIRGPDRTPFEGLWWSLIVLFPRSYPAVPPDFRFLAVPYHENISPEGRVLWEAVDAGYRATHDVRRLLEDIYWLLARPSQASVLRPAVAEERQKDPALWAEKARQAVCGQAKQEINDYPYFRQANKVS